MLVGPTSPSGAGSAGPSAPSQSPAASDRLRVVQPDQLALLLLEIRHAHLGQRLERAAQTATAAAARLSPRRASSRDRASGRRRCDRPRRACRCGGSARRLCTAARTSYSTGVHASVHRARFCRLRFATPSASTERRHGNIARTPSPAQEREEPEHVGQRRDEHRRGERRVDVGRPQPERNQRRRRSPRRTC